MPMYCHRITVSYFKRIPSNKKNKCITINDKNDTTLYHETANPKNLYIKPLLIISYNTGKKDKPPLKKFAHPTSEYTIKANLGSSGLSKVFEPVDTLRIWKDILNMN